MILFYFIFYFYCVGLIATTPIVTTIDPLLVAILNVAANNLASAMTCECHR